MNGKRVTGNCYREFDQNLNRFVFLKNIRFLEKIEQRREFSRLLLTENAGWKLGP